MPHAFSFARTGAADYWGSVVFPGRRRRFALLRAVDMADRPPLANPMDPGRAEEPPGAAFPGSS